MTDKIIEKLKLFLKKDDIPIKCADNAIKRGVDGKHVELWTINLACILKRLEIPDFEIEEILEEWNKCQKKPLKKELLDESIKKGFSLNEDETVPDCKQENVNAYCFMPCPNAGVSQSQMICDDPQIYRTKTGYLIESQDKRKGLVRVTNFLIESAKLDEGLQSVDLIIRHGTKEVNIELDIPIKNDDLLFKSAVEGIPVVLFRPNLFKAILTVEISITKLKTKTPVDLDSIFAYIEDDIKLGLIFRIEEERSDIYTQEQFKLGWVRENKVYLKFATWCNSHGIKDIKKFSKFLKSSKLVNPSKVTRYPIKDGRSVRVWIIKLNQEITQEND